MTLFHKVDMVSGIPPVGINQNERFLSCDTLLLGVRYVDIHYTKMRTVAWWLRHYVTNRQVAGSIPDSVIGVFQ